ncbi:MAG TPA: DUF2283 domain-containing protein [Thermoanaerobaculia bacterium]|jgi:uncharacterized protein YuzE|nr:DUF2283 domain-containing protein [Thermoanaerobaculia bacterium]
MRITYARASDALAIDFRDAEYDESEEIYNGFVIDFEKSGRPMGIEIYYEASKFVDIERLTKMVPEEITSEIEAPPFIRDRSPT